MVWQSRKQSLIAFRALCAAANQAERAGHALRRNASTVYSMIDARRRDISILTIKKLCDGLDVTLGEFFSTPAFDNLEQEIK